jgi:hypothetical protein
MVHIPEVLFTPDSVSIAKLEIHSLLFHKDDIIWNTFFWLKQENVPLITFIQPFFTYNKKCVFKSCSCQTLKVISFTTYSLRT